MRPLALVIVSVLAPTLAMASPVRPLREPGTAVFGELVAGPETVDGLVFARQVLPPSTASALVGTAAPTTDEPGTVAFAQSRVIYLNRGGVTLQPGDNDARVNRSTLATQATTIAAWDTTATTWSATVSCMRELFAAYDVTITETDPGNVPHIEAVFGGTPSQLAMAPNTAGVAPFTTSCGVIENAMVFTFTQILPNDARLACEIMAQEVAHAYGLDHEMLAADPMTYLEYSGNRSFQNQAASCGEAAARPCGINGSTCRPSQNSVALLTERLGLKSGATPPNPTMEPTDPGEVTGGCSTGGGSGLLVGLALAGLLARRRSRCPGAVIQAPRC